MAHDMAKHHVRPTQSHRPSQSSTLKPLSAEANQSAKDVHECHHGFVALPTFSESGDLASDDAQPMSKYAPVVVLVALMWAGEIIDIVIPGSFDRFGIQPRSFSGLSGILFAPLLHSGFAHLIANTLPFLVLGAIVATSGIQRFATVTATIWLLGGLGTWLTGSAHSIHIGASGIVFGYLTYLVARGFVAKNLLYIGVGVLVFFVYGSILWGLIPAPGISWQGHLFGALSGVAAAVLVHGDSAKSRANA